MSDISLDFRPLFIAALLAIGAPILMLILARFARRIRFWPRLALVTGGGIGIATPGGVIAEAALQRGPSMEPTWYLAFMGTVVTQSLASLGFLVFGHRP